MTESSKPTRREHIADYKRTERQMGIYAVRNTTNGKLYVASSVDVRARINRHRFQLLSGSETVKALQQDYNDLGAEAFEYEVLDTLDPLPEPHYNPAEDLLVLKQMWLARLQPWGERGYNDAPDE